MNLFQSCKSTGIAKRFRNKENLKEPKELCEYEELEHGFILHSCLLSVDFIACTMDNLVQRYEGWRRKIMDISSFLGLSSPSLMTQRKEVTFLFFIT